MLTIDRVEFGVTSIGTQVIEPNNQPVSNWMQDPRLVESYREYTSLFKQAEQGDKKIPALRLPTFYVPLAIRLAIGGETEKGWGEVDKNEYIVGSDSQGRTDYAISLYRDGREEHVATVFPHAFRNDEIARVYSIEKAEDFLNLLYDAKLREEESWRRVNPIDIYVLEPQRHGIV